MIMHRTRLVTVVALLLMAIPVAAHADPTPAELLIETWEWVSSLDPWSGTTSTPATSGYTMQLQCFADGTAVWFQDEQVEQTTTWEFRTNGLDPFLFLYIGNWQFFYQITQDSLHLDNRHVDGPLMIFSRRQPVPLQVITWGRMKADFGHE